MNRKLTKRKYKFTYMKACLISIILTEVKKKFTVMVFIYHVVKNPKVWAGILLDKQAFSDSIGGSGCVAHHHHAPRVAQIANG